MKTTRCRLIWRNIMKQLPMMILLWAMMASSSFASVILNISEVGNNVVATGSGTINTAGFTGSFTGGFTALTYIFPKWGIFEFGTLGSSTDWTGFSVPKSFGSPIFTSTSNSSGSILGVDSFNNRLSLPSNYISGALLNTSAQWNSKSFATLGLTPGTFTWTWGSGPNADSLTLNVGAAVPEPSTYALFVVGLGGWFTLRRMRPQKRQ